jgi:uncharacterized protein (DUF983 family)
MLPRCPQCGQETPASALFRSSYKCEACDADLEMDNGTALLRLMILLTIVASLPWLFPFGMVVIAIPILLLAFLRYIPLKVRE